MALDLVEQLLRGELDSCENKIDLWRANHEVAMLYFDTSDLVKKTNDLFESITRLDDDFRNEFYNDPSRYDDWKEAKIDELFRRWTFIAHSLLKDLVPWAEKEFNGVVGSDTLRRRLSESVGIVADPAEFYQGDELVAARDQAIDEHLNGQRS